MSQPKTVPAPLPATVREPITDWSVFQKLRLNPKIIRCDSYKPVHGYDATCHTTLRPRTDSILSHIDAGHSGAFFLELKEVPEGAKVWSGWEDLKQSGAEVVDFRGAHTMGNATLVNIHEVNRLMRPHIGSNKKTVEGGKFYLTISLPNLKPEVPEDEE